nr:TIM barrel protein [Mycolicibacterium chubuense]
MDARLSVHNVTFLGATLDELCTYWEALGVTRLSVIDTQLQELRLADVIDAHGFTVETVYHLFSSTDGLRRVIDAAAAIGARAVYMLTGGRGGAAWEEAADAFCTAVQPCRTDARGAGVTLAIENASPLYADIHIAHTLRDTIELAEMADIGVCVDLFHCWTEAHLPVLIERALPRTAMIQLSDYVLGDRALPGRAVPGDGAIPVEQVVAQVLAGGYPHGFDLELIGPRIEREGRLQAARRACETVSAMLERAG